MIIKPYSGTDDYIFISYAHKDSELVFPIIEQMQKDRYNVWFDEGIDPGTEWPKTVADRLYRCAFFIALMSENYLASTNCIDELEFARNKEKSRVILYLQDIALPIEVELRHGRIQAIFWFKYTEKAEAFNKLYSTKGITGSRSKDEKPDIESDSAVKIARQSSELPDGPNVISNAAYLPPTPDEAFRFRYDEKDDGWSISLRYDEKYTEIKIPENHQGKPVSIIAGNGFEGCERLTRVTIPSSVHSIMHGAFRGCESLASITIPSGVKVIGSCAFWGCKSLTSITIPSSVFSIDEYAFAYCENLTSITISSGVRHIGKRVFYSCKNLTSVTVPSSVHTIGDGAFIGCRSLASITIPSGIRVFGSRVFYGCVNLENIIWLQDNNREEQMRRVEFYQKLGRCRYCGGSFKKILLSTKCKECGEKKDY